MTLRGATGSIESLSRSIAGARVDLNPHQVDAALFAIRSPLAKGVILADEVGLGKTVEAGIVIAQKWAERRRRMLIIVPATLRKQWQQEIQSKFYVPTRVLDTRTYKELQDGGQLAPLEDTDHIHICSYYFAFARAQEVQRVPWDLVVVDEAHRLRNVYKKSSKLGRGIADAIRQVPKLLLTATPLQNSLLELYGLASVIDEHMFGDAATFRDQFVNAADDQSRNEDLKRRLRPICIRTLRKQVVEYIPFTRRQPITQNFHPSDAEQTLYEAVSTYLQREILIALPTSQRTLITLVLRKLMASSTFAIAATLNRMATRLEKRRDALAKLLDEEDLEGIDALEDEIEEQDQDAESEAAGPPPAVNPDLVKQEILELRGYVEQAKKITSNAKGEALVGALKIAFEKATALGAAKKAVIFTESRRTQEYLFELLTRNGYEGQLVLMNASNGDPGSTAIYEAWRIRHKGEESVTGSRPVDIKAAIVEHFRDQGTILIATEAAAEGVNLQFCSLVVNYDLPWNPQRIEQRIGRCHRYGQKHDVVVVNFLNQRNEADQRVLEILTQKFNLFDGVFGSSDEVLGALESGVDIERRIARVYQTCRNSEEIKSAFDALQRELDGQIQARMAETRKTLLENFDEDVSARLRVHKDKTLESLGERERWLLELTRTELGKEAQFEVGKPRFRYAGAWYHFDWRETEKSGDIFYRQDQELAAQIIQNALARVLHPASVHFEYGTYGQVVSVLKPFLGSKGWLELTKLNVQSLDIEEFLVFSARSDDGRVLDEESCRKLLSLPAKVLEAQPGEAPSLDDLRKTGVDGQVKKVEERNGKLFDEEVFKLDRWSDDVKQGLEREIKDLDRQIREARRTSTQVESLKEKLEAQKSLKALEGERNRKRRELFESQDRIDAQRDGLIQKIEGQLQQKLSLQSIFRIRWSLM